jgi:hypothetical protein
MLSTPSCPTIVSIGLVGFGKLSAVLWYSRTNVALLKAEMTFPSPAVRDAGQVFFRFFWHVAPAAAIGLPNRSL